MKKLLKKLLKNAALIGIASGMCAFLSCKASQPDSAVSGVKTISAEEAKKMMDTCEDCVIVDVREESEYAQGHVPGARLIPLGEIETRAEKELPDKAQTILLYCRSGRRSSSAAAKLVKLGYTDIYDFGGIINWPYETES